MRCDYLKDIFQNIGDNNHNNVAGVFAVRAGDRGVSYFLDCFYVMMKSSVFAEDFFNKDKIIKIQEKKRLYDSPVESYTPRGDMPKYRNAV